MEPVEMPLERNWFAFNWFSDFFKDLTEAASSENLLSRQRQSVDPLDAAVMAGLLGRNSCKAVKEADVATLWDRILQLQEARKLPPNFALPSHFKINRYLSGYFGYFDPHTPVVHAQTFDFSTFSRMWANLPS